MLASDNILAPAALALLLFAAPAGRALADSAEETIQATLGQWTRDFNARKADEVCNLFSPELRYDFRGYPERGYDDICALLHRSLRDPSRTYKYALEIKDIFVSGDLAVVRLTWTLTVALPNGQIVTTIEPGMDVLRKDKAGAWKIIRYVAYEQPQPPVRQNE